MVPKNHECADTALASAQANNTTAVVIKTYTDGEISALDYMTFRNITNSGDLVTDFPIVLEENQRISEIKE